MRWNCIKKYILCILAGVGLLTGIAGMQVEAGSSNLIVNNESFKKELDTTLWNATDGRISVKNGNLVFAKDSKKSTALITKTIANNTGYHDELVKVKATMDLANIPKDQTFAVVLGLGSIESIMGEPGNVEIQFTNNGKLRVSVVVYDMDNKKIEVLAPQSAGAASNISMEATISAKQLLTLNLNGKKICEKELPISGEGRVGFLQTGSCGVTIKDVDIQAYRYDRPENVDIYEDFEEESINVNALTAKMVFASGRYVPYGMEIKSLDDNRVMEFKNMNGAYIGSMYTYSNFELTFDVIGLQRVSEFDENGNEIVPKSDNIVVSFGDEASDYEGWGYETSPDAVVFYYDSQVYSMNQGHRVNAADKGYDYTDADCKKDFTIRVSMIDGVVTASMKWIEEKEFTEILKYKVSDKTPMGYVHIWGVGEKATNFSVDNVKLINKDKDPNLTTVEFKSAIHNVPEDFKYEKIGYVYREEAETEEEKNMSPYLFLPITAVVCAMAFGLVVLFSKKKKIITSAIAVLLSISMIAGCAGSADTEIQPMEAEESVAVSYDIIGGKDVMPFGTQWGPYMNTALSEDGQMPPYMITDEMWSDLSDMGINLLFHNADHYNVNKELIMDALDLSAKYNMAYYVTDGKIREMILDETDTLENVTTRMSEYMNHPAFGGVHLVDEAKTMYWFPEAEDAKLLDYYKNIGPMLNQDLQLMPYHQVYPSLNDPNNRDRYMQYVEEFCDVMQPQYLAMNRYPLIAEYRNHLDMLFFDIGVVWKNAKENGIPWWSYFGAGSQWNDASRRFNTEGYYPEEGAYDWHINVSLAFGMQGIIIFPGVQPYHFAYSVDPTMDFERNGCIGVWGNKNRWYYYTQDIAKHVQAIDEVLMNSVNKGVIVSGAQANEDVKYARELGCIIEGDSFRELESVSGDAMVGCFNYQGKTALYVANYDQEYSQDITLTLKDTYKVTVIQDGKVNYVQSDELTLKMLAGDGVLLVFE